MDNGGIMLYNIPVCFGYGIVMPILDQAATINMALYKFDDVAYIAKEAGLLDLI